MTRAQQTIVLVVLGVGCTRDNPAFDEGADGDAEAGAPTSGSEPTSGVGPTSEPTSDAESTTLSEPTASGTTDTTVGLDSGETTEGSAESVGACTPTFPPRHVLDFLPALDLGRCPQTHTLTLMVTETTGMSAQANLCDEECPCPEDPEVEVDVDVSLPALPFSPICVQLTLDLVADGVGCEVLAYALRPYQGPMGAPPFLVVSSVVDPAFDDPFEFQLAERVTEACGDGCNTAAAGYYGLTTDSLGATIPPQDMSEVGSFVVTNEGSGIDESCAEIGRWHARLMP